MRRARHATTSVEGGGGAQVAEEGAAVDEAAGIPEGAAAAGVVAVESGRFDD